MEEKTKKLKDLQDKVHSIMYEISNDYKEDDQSKLIIMNLTKTSKELLDMINISIVGEKVSDDNELLKS